MLPEPSTVSFARLSYVDQREAPLSFCCSIGHTFEEVELVAYSITRLEPSVLAAFEGIPKLTSVTGPQNLIRLAAAVWREPGRWWFEERLFWNAFDQAAVSDADPAILTHLLRTILRQDFAVSYDWNRMLCFYRLALPPGTGVAAWQGRARYQPEYSLQHRLGAQHHARLRLLFGGGYQYFIPNVPAELVHGPFPLRVAVGRA